jgi:1-acyl-sn-glycerol-3-phosphate acyltransferase
MIIKRLNYLWRLFGTGVSFSLFGIVGVAFWGGVFPILNAFIPQQPARKRFSRKMMCRLFLWFMNFMRGIGILDYRVQGVGRINTPGRVVVANHPCLLDIVFLISQMPNAMCVVKPQLATNPFMRIPIAAMGYLYANHPEDLLDRCRDELADGCGLIVFPEGTRTVPGAPLKFQRGAAAIALHAGVPIVPVRLGCRPLTLTKRSKWYEIPSEKFVLSLVAGDDFSWYPPDDQQCRSLASRQLTRALERYFLDVSVSVNRG